MPSLHRIIMFFPQILPFWYLQAWYKLTFIAYFLHFFLAFFWLRTYFYQTKQRWGNIKTRVPPKHPKDCQTAIPPSPVLKYCISTARSPALFLFSLKTPKTRVCPQYMHIWSFLEYFSPFIVSIDLFPFFKHKYARGIRGFGTVNGWQRLFWYRNLNSFFDVCSFFIWPQAYSDPLGLET